MGLFDLHLKKDIKIKDANLFELEKELSKKGKSHNSTSTLIEIEKYKKSGSLLSYDLKIFKEKNQLVIDGELKETLFLTILILLSILFTYGIGVILVVVYTYYQKLQTQKDLNTLIDEQIKAKDTV